MKTQISKHFSGSKHDGWKRTIGGRSCFLGFGTSAASEARAVRLAEVIAAKWSLAKAAGATELTETDVQEARDLINDGPRWSAEARERHGVPAVPGLPDESRQPSAISAPESRVAGTTPPEVSDGRRWLQPSISEFIATTWRTFKPDQSNEDNVVNICNRMERTRALISDRPLDQFKRKELDEWLVAVRNSPNKNTGGSLKAATVRNLVQAIRLALVKFAEWEWWVPPPMWGKAFAGYPIKKLQSTAERKTAQKRPLAHSLTEKRVLWHISLPFARALMGLADWAGHTQKEIATLTFEEIVEDGEAWRV